MEFSKCVNQVNCKYLPFASQRQIALLVGRFSLVKGHWQYHSLLSVYSSFPHFFNSDRVFFFTSISPQLNRNEASCNILDLDYEQIDEKMEQKQDFSLLHSAKVLFLSDWKTDSDVLLLKLLARNDPLHLVGVRHLVLEKNHHHGLWPRLLGSRNSEYQNYFHSLLSEGAPEKIAAASDLPWADAWRFLGWLHKWQVGCGKLF